MICMSYTIFFNIVVILFSNNLFGSKLQEKTPKSAHFSILFFMKQGGHQSHVTTANNNNCLDECSYKSEREQSASMVKTKTTARNRSLEEVCMFLVSKSWSCRCQNTRVFHKDSFFPALLSWLGLLVPCACRLSVCCEWGMFWHVIDRSVCCLAILARDQSEVRKCMQCWQWRYRPS